MSGSKASLKAAAAKEKKEREAELKRIRLQRLEEDGDDDQDYVRSVNQLFEPFTHARVVRASIHPTQADLTLILPFTAHPQRRASPRSDLVPHLERQSPRRGQSLRTAQRARPTALRPRTTRTTTTPTFTRTATRAESRLSEDRPSAADPPSCDPTRRRRSAARARVKASGSPRPTTGQTSTG